jgi:hypothetical protein
MNIYYCEDDIVDKRNSQLNNTDIDKIKNRHENIINNLRIENKKLKDKIIAFQPPEYNLKPQADRKKDILKGIKC